MKKKKEIGRTSIPALMGEYASEDELLTWAREFFLSTLMNVARAPLFSLRDEILPRYSDAFNIEETRGNSFPQIKELAVGAFLNAVTTDRLGIPGSNAEYQVLRSSSPDLYAATEHLLEWSKRFNLTGRQKEIDESANPQKLKTARMDTVWPMVAALETVLQWHFGSGGYVETLDGVPMWRPRSFQFPKELDVLPAITTIRHDPRASIAPELLKQVDPNGTPLRESTEQITQGWYITIESEANFRDRLRKDFDRWLEEYIAKRHEAARAAGLVKTPGKRDLARFVWAARYQVEKAFTSQISKEYNVSKEAVTEGINWVLALIRLDARPRTRGRKPGLTGTIKRPSKHTSRN